MKTKIRLPREFRNKWLKALTGGKYKQTKGLLLDIEKNSYCCLGVAGRCLNIPKKILVNKGFPSALDDKYKNKYPKAFLNEGEYSVEDTTFAEELANRNDSGFTFKEIAQYIKSNTRGV